jgi:hypothetical protein
MRCCVIAFIAAEGIVPVDLAVALVQRGFESLFATQHSHVSRCDEASVSEGVRYRRSTTACWIHSFR